MGQVPTPSCQGGQAGDPTGCLQFVDHGENWYFIGVQNPIFTQLSNRMNELGFSTGLMPDGLAGLTEGVVQGLYQAWMRSGKKTNWWVQALTTNIGALPIWDGPFGSNEGRFVRVHPAMWDWFFRSYGPSPLGPDAPRELSPDGYIWIVGGTSVKVRDRLLDVIVGRLIDGGYLPPLGPGETLEQRTNGYWGPGNSLDPAGVFVGTREPKTGLWAAWADLRAYDGAPPGGPVPPLVHGSALMLKPGFLTRIFQPLPLEIRTALSRWPTAGNFKKIVGAFPTRG
jgi:hypothetical protein